VAKGSPDPNLPPMNYGKIEAEFEKRKVGQQ
jgi:hypothetical protein